MSASFLHFLCFELTIEFLNTDYKTHSLQRPLMENNLVNASSPHVTMVTHNLVTHKFTSRKFMSRKFTSRKFTSFQSPAFTNNKMLGKNFLPIRLSHTQYMNTQQLCVVSLHRKRWHVVYSPLSARKKQRSKL